MRHIASMVLALVLAPAIYLCAGLSAVKLGEAGTGPLTMGTAGLGVLAALVAGGLFAVLVMARLSPVGPVVAGLLFLGATAWAVLDADSFRSTVPANLGGVDGLMHAPVPFGTALLAVPLLSTVFSPRRWRTVGDYGAGGYDAAPVYPPPPESAAPSYGPLMRDEDTLYTPPTYDR